MLKSISQDWGHIEVPDYNGKVTMLPFELSDLSSLPIEFKTVVENMIEKLPNKIGQAFLTVHGKFVEKGNTLRRPLPHIDGNYILEGKGGWNSGGWKVGVGGRELSSEHHKLSYENSNGGMIITSNYSACKGWNGVFNEKAGIGGDCSHINLDEGFVLEANKIYYGNSQFIHESLPVNEDVFRTMYRITLPLDYEPLLD